MARRVALPGGGVTIASQHLRWPWPYSQWFHIDALAPALAEAGSPLVIGGDFNAVPWSAAVESYAAASGTEAVGGIGPTWLHPSLPGRWRRVVGLPIDNILVSPGVTITAVSRPMATASDHLPVLVAFRRRERR
jgi:endonuclease/exonuclease/phosphatase (EEP) superfamily protein YafD